VRGVEDKPGVMLPICYQLLYSKTFCILVANFKVWDREQVVYNEVSFFLGSFSLR